MIRIGLARHSRILTAPARSVPNTCSAPQGCADAYGGSRMPPQHLASRVSSRSQPLLQGDLKANSIFHLPQLPDSVLRRTQPSYSGTHASTAYRIRTLSLCTSFGLCPFAPLLLCPSSLLLASASLPASRNTGCHRAGSQPARVFRRFLSFFAFFTGLPANVSYIDPVGKTGGARKARAACSTTE